MFKAVTFAQLLCGAYILTVTFTHLGQLGKFGGARDPVSGFIIDTTSEENTNAGVLVWNGALRSVVAQTQAEMILLGFSRFSGFFMYPALILVFLTKLRATCAFLSSTLFNMFLYQDMHRLHVYCGWVILIDSCVHATCHLTRWALQGNLYLLFHHTSGITGFIVILSTFLICTPMMIFKNMLKYEIRKLAHYFFLVFGIAMCFHAPKSAVPNGGFCAYIFPILLIWYGLDALFCALFMTELIETTRYHTLPSGVQMTMAVSKRFQSMNHGGYAYVCFPWVDRHQWHAFSLFENPKNPEERQVFMQTTGDWTTKVHELLQRDTVRPVWIQGPFPNPYKNAITYDNQILVAAGIGITPALSVIRAHKDYRRINLIWAVRDPAMLQFFLEHAYLDNRGWNLIFYTGKAPLVSSLINLATTNVCIIHSRPKLDQLVPNIVYGIESGEGRPERYLPDQKVEATHLLREELNKLDMVPEMTPKQKICNLAEYAEDLGYTFYDLVHNMDDIDDDLQFKRVPSNSSLDVTASLDTTAYGSRDWELDTEMGLTTADDVFMEDTVQCVNETTLHKLRKYRFSRSASNQYTRSPDETVLQLQWHGLMDDMTQNFKPWEEHPLAAPYAKSLDPYTVKSTWGILYYGGKSGLLTSLEEVANDIGIKLHSESFEW